MAFERRIDIKVNINDAKPKVDFLQASFVKADASAKSFSKSAEDTSKSIKEVGKESSASAKKVDNLDKESKQLSGSLNSVDASAKKASGSLKGMRGIAQSAGFQLQDVAVQAQAGTDAFVILGQQGSQFAGAFGPGGAVLGAVIAVGAAIAGVLNASLEDTIEETQTVNEKFTELVSKYDELTAAQQRFVGVQAVAEIEKLEKNINSLTNTAEGLQNQLNTPIASRSDKELKALSDRLIEVNSDIDTFRKRIEELQGTTGGTGVAASQFIDALNLQAASIGKTDRELALYAAAMKGADKAQIAQLNTIFDFIEAKEKEIEAQDLAKKKAKEAEDQKKRDERTQARANESARNAVKALIDERDATEEGERALFIYRKTKAEIARIEKSSLTDKQSLIDIARDEAGAIFDANKERKDQLKLEKDLAKAARESDKEYEKLYNNLSDNLTDAILGYKDLEDVALDVAANIARAFVQQNITAPILGAAGFPAPGGAGQSAGGSLISSGISSALSPLTSAVNGLASEFALSGVGASLGLSTGLSGATLASTYGLTTGVAGTSALTGAGSFLSSAAGGLATAGIGLLAAPILESIFGGKPSDKTQFSSIDLSADSIDIGGFEGDKFSQENRDAASLLGQSAIAVSNSLEAVSGKDITDAFNIIVGSRDAIRLETQAFNAAGGLASDQATRFITETDPQKFADEVARFFAASIDVNLESFESLRNEGEILADAIIRVTSQAQIAAPLLEVIGINIGGLGDTALASADLLIDAVGGIDALGVASQFYYANFFSEEERAQVVRDAAQAAVDEFNATLGLTGESALDTRDELRGYIESLDATTSAGAKAAGTALTFADEIAFLDDGLSDVVESVIEVIDTTDLQIRLLSEQNKAEEALALTRKQQLDTASDAEDVLLKQIFAQEDYNSAVSEAEGAVTSATSAVRASIKTEQDAIRDDLASTIELINNQISDLNSAYDDSSVSIQAQIASIKELSSSVADDLRNSIDRASDSVSGIGRVIDTIESAITSTQSTSDAATLARRRVSQGVIRGIVSGSIAPTQENVESAVSGIGGDTARFFKTQEDFARDQAITSNSLIRIKDNAEEELTTAERSLAILEQQLTVGSSESNELIEKLESDLIIATDQHEESVGRLRALIEQEQANANAQIDTLNLQLAEQVKQSEIALGTFKSAVTIENSIKSLDIAIRDALSLPAPTSNNIPQFASGGLHSGGLRIVGENGPELEFTGPSRIISNAQSSSLLSNEEIVLELRALRADQNAANLAIAKNTMKTSKILDNWDALGIPEERVL